MLDDTIAALSTAPGRAGLAVIRISGSEAGAIAAALGLPDLEARLATYAAVRHPETGELLDRVVATRFAAPASYTGEEILELSCHGGSLVPQLVLDAALAAGARHAEPGEFTRRAFLNGKLDLVQIEATLDLIDAASAAGHRAAVSQLEGQLSLRVDGIRAGILRLQALISYDIDFPEEDDGPIAPEKIRAATADVVDRLETLLRHAPEGELLREGALTVIAGRPNCGKSSLFNALVGRDRAIVTDLPGTTRDAIEAVVSLAGYPFRLVDTAGIRRPAGTVEAIGIEVARRYLDDAAVILFCAEAGRALDDAEREFIDTYGAAGRPLITVRTKGDLMAAGSSGTPGSSGRGESPSARESSGGGSEIVVSSVSGEGLSDLRVTLVEAVFRGLRADEASPLLTRRRQVRNAAAARDEVDRFRLALDEGLPTEIAASHLLEATSALEELLGVIDTEEVLGAVFAQFCVGK